MAKKKFEFEIDYQEDQKCDKCENMGAMDFAGEYLCPSCVAKDVFEDYSEQN